MQLLFAMDGWSSVESDGVTTQLAAGRIVVLPAEGVEYVLRGKGEVIRIAQSSGT
jgi:mannose-6-phosphate isomerase class I